MSYQEITALSQDLGGNLWLGTNAAGVMKLARNGFVTYDEQHALHGSAVARAKLTPPSMGFVSLSLIVAPLLSADRKETLGHFRLDLVRAGRVRRAAM